MNERKLIGGEGKIFFNSFLLLEEKNLGLSP
jgi:hypothetical protein